MSNNKISELGKLYPSSKIIKNDQKLIEKLQLPTCRAILDFERLALSEIKNNSEMLKLIQESLKNLKSFLKSMSNNNSNECLSEVPENQRDISKFSTNTCTQAKQFWTKVLKNQQEISKLSINQFIDYELVMLYACFILFLLFTFPAIPFIAAEIAGLFAACFFIIYTAINIFVTIPKYSNPLKKVINSIQAEIYLKNIEIKNLTNLRSSFEELSATDFIAVINCHKNNDKYKTRPWQFFNKVEKMKENLASQIFIDHI